MDGKRKKARVDRSGKEATTTAQPAAETEAAAAASWPRPAAPQTASCVTDDGDGGGVVTVDAAVALAGPGDVDDDDNDQLPASLVLEAGDESGAGEEDDDDGDDDEQMERFYALLASIRAMRGLAPCLAAVGAGGTERRPRAAEPPWRPAFRLEDFGLEPSSPASASTSASPGPSSKRQRHHQAEDDGGDGESTTTQGPVQCSPRRRGTGSRSTAHSCEKN